MVRSGGGGIRGGFPRVPGSHGPPSERCAATTALRRVQGSAPGPSCPCPPEPGPLYRPRRRGRVGRWNREGEAFAAELLLTSQTLLFASVGSVPLFVPDNLFFCLLTYI